jgi:hypothetical protein
MNSMEPKTRVFVKLMSKNSISDNVGFKLRKSLGSSFALKCLKQQMVAQYASMAVIFLRSLNVVAGKILTKRNDIGKSRCVKFIT